MLAGVTPRSFGVLGLTFQFPAVLSTFQLPGVLTGADQASTAAGGDDRLDGSPVQARPGRAPGVLVVATRVAVPTMMTNAVGQLIDPSGQPSSASGQKGEQPAETLLDQGKPVVIR